MPNILDEILANKRLEVERRRIAQPLARLQAALATAPPLRDFHASVSGTHGQPAVIAEVKRSSPSAGLIASDFDPVVVARRYESAGASALSVLTDERYFGGDLGFIEQTKAAVRLPVLRKDFIVDEYQLYESRAAGADAILLIAEALSPDEIGAFAACATQLGLCVLLEVHSGAALQRALAAVPPGAHRRLLLGINNRNLATQRVDLATFEQVAPLAPPNLVLVAESGLKTSDDVRRMVAAGARALLIGETLMRSGDPAATMRQLLDESWSA